ncbi:hypothetical protein [Aquisphaera insulae]|uniref:hypothetical protein n=1 Tax=Aquisphaera insulae TaxID=2712864 RepID=UPI0013ED5174|nr:hypothetical protein [Aquisphaera insulae]
MSPGLEADGLLAVLGFSGSSPERLWIGAIAAALLGAIMGWSFSPVLDAWTRFDRVATPTERAADMGAMSRLIGGRNEQELREAVIGMGCLGGVLGLLSGAAGGVARRTPRGAVGGASLGLILGVAAGVASPELLVPTLLRVPSANPWPAIPVFVHTADYVAVGAAAATALGLAVAGRAGAVRAAIAGAIGATFGSLLFHALHGILFPLEREFGAMPGIHASRLLGHLCVALSVACCTAIALVPYLRLHPTPSTLPR